MIKLLFAYRNLIFILILLNSGCIFLTEDKIAGIPLLREVYLAMVVFASTVLIVLWKNIRHSKTAAWIIFFGLALPIFSAGLAKLNWGQPLIYGLLEERRSFNYLIFFPAYFLMVKFRPSLHQIQSYVLVSGLSCVLVGYLYYFKLVPQNTNVFFEIDVKDGADVLRPDRFRIGANYVSLCALMMMYSIKRCVTLPKIITLAVFAIYLWTVLQTRNTMVIWVLAAIWIFRDRTILICQITGFVVVMGILAYMLVPEAFVGQQDKLLALINQATESPGVRHTTIALSLAEVAKNNFLGLGALSLQWNDGFSRIYNEWFYLADVGIVGIYYRFGLFAPFIALFFYLGFIRFVLKSRVKSDLLSAYQLDFVFSMFNLLLSNSIMFGGDSLGLAAALFLYASKLPAVCDSSKEYANKTPISYSHYKSQ